MIFLLLLLSEKKKKKKIRSEVAFESLKKKKKEKAHKIYSFKNWATLFALYFSDSLKNLLKKVISL